MQKIDPAVIERAARAHATSQDAARALGCNRATFSRLCTKYRIESPAARKQRQRRGGAQ